MQQYLEHLVVRWMYLDGWVMISETKPSCWPSQSLALPEPPSSFCSSIWLCSKEQICRFLAYPLQAPIAFLSLAFTVVLCTAWWSVSLLKPPCIELSRGQPTSFRQIPQVAVRWRRMGEAPRRSRGHTHTYRTYLHTLTASPSPAFFPLEYICCYTSGVLSEKDKSVYQQIRSLPRWSNYRYLRQRGSGCTGPLGIGWQSQIRLYLYLHTVGKTSPIPCTELKERNLGHFIH